jgi:hypothetical protein
MEKVGLPKVDRQGKFRLVEIKKQHCFFNVWTGNKKF